MILIEMKDWIYFKLLHYRRPSDEDIQPAKAIEISDYAKCLTNNNDMNKTVGEREVDTDKNKSEKVT